MLRFLTGGESHGLALVTIIDGAPSNLPLAKADIDRDLERRQMGYGRGGRMSIERDAVDIASGVRGGRTLGSPISLIITNKDWPNWAAIMDVEAAPPVDAILTKPRPGHADLSGLIKYGFGDVRDVLERASARETAARVAVGAVAKRLLAEFGISVESAVLSIGAAATERGVQSAGEGALADKSPVRCLDEDVARGMMAGIDEAGAKGETLGGVFEVAAFGVPVGLGSYTQWDRRLDAALARAMMSIPAIKGVEIGDGFRLAERTGSEAHDEISYAPETGFFRSTNRAGGLEAGMTNGSAVRLRAAMKPIPTLGKPLMTVDIITKAPAEAISERSDVCAVPAASVVGEAVVAIELANALLSKFGGDNLDEIGRAFTAYKEANQPE
jgi:chorismate synthase